MWLKLSNQDFAYEVQALLKAFFPSEPIRLAADDTEPAATDGEAMVYVTADELDCTDNQEMNVKAGISFYINGIPVLQREEIHKAATRRDFKNVVKHLIYSELSSYTGKELPWGTLTGVRPTKLMMECMEQGMQDDKIRAMMRDVYDCSGDKIELGMHIVSKELKLLEGMDYKNGYSIYIGIPFCPTTCLYCSFTSYSFKQYGYLAEAYLEALAKEIDYAAACLPGRKLTTVYVGGGTPTSINEEELERLLKKIRETLDFTFVKEFTVEAGRPDSITYEKLVILKRWGVTRISINPQTMNQATLDLIGRKHTVEQVQEAFHLARKAGHNNINMDLIAGLPGENIENVSKTLTEVGELHPDSITIHSLAIKRAAFLNMQKEKYKDITYGDTAAMIGMGERFAKEHGYQPYYLYRQKNATGSRQSSRENVGYALPGKEGLYNILIMEEKQTILALGAGATSKFVFPDESRLERVENVKFVKDYVERIDEMIERKKSFIEREM